MSPVSWVRTAAELARLMESIEELFAELVVARARLLPGADRVACAYAAVMLHHLYTAIESALERICRTVEGSVPGGPDDHVSFLRDATLELPGIRPAILQAARFSPLFEMLRFRHFVRHAYSVQWDITRLRVLSDTAVSVWPEVRSDLDAFRLHLLGPVTPAAP